MLARAANTRKATAALAAASLSLAVVGCGKTAVKPVAPVQISALSPTDGTRVATNTVTVTGTVTPHRARVMVLGHHVATGSDGRFSTTVALQTGTNLIDVIAGAPNAHPAMTALRVVRYVLVSVPQVGGKSPQAAVAAIRAAGLTPKLKGDSDPFSFLLPVSQEVCSQDPAANTHVSPGSTVTLSIGKVCL